MVSKNSGASSWRINQSLQTKSRKKEKLDQLAKAIVKEIKTNEHALDFSYLPNHIKFDPGWRMIKKGNTATGAINVLLSIGGTINELEYVVRKMYSLDSSLFLKWGGFLDNQTGKTIHGFMRKHINYQAGTYPKNRPQKGYVFECTRSLKDLQNDDYFHIIGIWEKSPSQVKLFLNTAEVKIELRGEIEKEIDKFLEKLVTKSKIQNYEKWKREYNGRVFDLIRPQRSNNLPLGITQPAGFEAHLICYLFDLLKEKDPHCQWSYRSYVAEADPRQRADIVYIQAVSEKLYEIWVEVGMFVGDTLKKYSYDFEKVISVVDQCKWCIGVLVHLESEPRGTVFNLFNSFKDEKSKNYSINIRKIGNENSIHLVRLIVRQKQ